MSARKLAVILIVLIITAPIAPSFQLLGWQNKDEKCREYLLALESYKKGNLKSALFHLDKSIELNSENYEAYELRGDILFQSKDYKSAGGCFHLLLSINGNTGPILKKRAYCFKEIGNFNEAILDLEEAIAMNCGDFKCFYELSHLYLAVNRPNKAVEFINQAISSDKNDAGAHCFKGSLLSLLKKHSDAIKAFDQAISLKPNVGAYYLFRAEAYSGFKKYEKAMADFSMALSLDPKNAFFYGARANSYVAQKKFDLAKDDYTKAIELDPNYIQPYISRATMFMEVKNFNEAIIDFSFIINFYDKQLSEKKVDSPEHEHYTYCELARFYQLRGNAKSAIGKSHEALQDFEKKQEITEKISKLSNNQRK